MSCGIGGEQLSPQEQPFSLTGPFRGHRPSPQRPGVLALCTVLRGMLGELGLSAPPRAKMVLDRNVCLGGQHWTK